MAANVDTGCDMTEEEISAVTKACDRNQLMCLGANLGSTAEFTSLLAVAPVIPAFPHLSQLLLRAQFNIQHYFLDFVWPSPLPP